MADTKNQDTVTGDKNSIYAAGGGYGPGPELAGDDSEKENTGADSKTERPSERKKSEAESSIRPSSRQQTTEIGRED